MIKINNLTKIYKSKNKKICKALDEVSFTLENKGLVYIIGKSGSGKSTLLNLIGGLDNITSGEIQVDGINLHEAKESDLYSFRGSNIGFIFQDFHLIETLTIKDNINLSLKLLNIDEENKIESILEKVELNDCLDKYPTELSGGQKQRVAIARALIKDPQIILADEPTGNLDSNTTKQITTLLKEISKDKLVLIVSHNLYDAYEYADRIIELSEGKIINDISKNKEYSNDISINDNSLFIPMLKRFSEDELDYIYQSIVNKKVDSIKQKKDKFVPSGKIDYVNENKRITKVNLPIKETIKFSYLFGKNRFIRLFFSSFLIALMTVVLYLGQSISFFKPATVIQDIMTTETSSFGIRKMLDTYAGEVGMKNISNDDIQKFYDKGYEGKIYKLYAVTAPLCNYHSLSELTYPTNKISSPYPNETTGVLQTNEEYAKWLLELDEIELYDLDVTYHPGGFYITDYVADAMLYAGDNSNFYKNCNSYQDLVGELSVTGANSQYIHLYVNGIIKTNYKEKYSEIIEELKTFIINGEFEYNEKTLNYYDDVSNSYALGFSFEEDFFNYYTNSPNTRNYQYIYSVELNGVKVWEGKSNARSQLKNKTLKNNEIMMSYTIYNKMFETNYTPANLDTFTPHAAKLTVSGDPDKKRFSEFEVTIAELSNSTNSLDLVLSEDLLCEFKRENTICYGVYFENHDSLDVIVDALEGDGYVIISNKVSVVSSMSKAVVAFNEFFNLIVFFIISTIIFLLISFGIKNINSNMYEIGVLKSLGCKQNRLAIIFGLHTILMILLTCVLSIVGVAMTYGFANTILVESLKVLAPSLLIIELNYIRFNINLILNDCFVVFGFSIVATIIAVIRLKSIKPILIIKAKE